MMKKILLALLLPACSTALCQHNFTRFIESRKVHFAIYATDTVHFSRPNISLLVREKLGKGTLKASIPTDNPNQGNIVFADPVAIRRRIAPNQEIKVVDAEGNMTATVKETGDPLLSSRYFDDQTSDMLEIPQVLYVESGRLRSYVPYFSAKYTVFTSWGQKLGISNGFSSGFNRDRSLSSSIRKKAKLIAGANTVIRLDTADQSKLLKQLYGQNLLQALWPDLHKKQFEIYRLDSMIKIPFEKLHMGLVSQVSVPVYDADGNLTGNNKYPMEDVPLLPSAFGEIHILQSWYYHEQKNILFSHLTELLLFPKASDTEGKPKEAVLKILLK